MLEFFSILKGIFALKQKFLGLDATIGAIQWVTPLKGEVMVDDPLFR